MEPAEAFGRALRHRRREASLTQEQLALEAGLERVFISWLETGRQQPSFQTMIKLASALNCSAAELVAAAEALMASASEE